MVRLYVLCVLAFVLLAACSKNNNDNEPFLYGTWVKGSNPGDTIIFMQHGTQHILQFPASVTPGVYTKLPYHYKRKKLSILLAADAAYPCNSFTWKTEGHSFELQGNDLYPYMSSIAPRYTYTKVN